MEQIQSTMVPVATVLAEETHAPHLFHQEIRLSPASVRLLLRHRGIDRDDERTVPPVLDKLNAVDGKAAEGE
ncbi:hypothetical protein WKI65_31610 [Streptomyces sp. MS1.AVA.3]